MDSERSLGLSVIYWLMGSVSIYSGMYGIGYLLRLQYLPGLALLVLCIVTLVFMVKGMLRVDQLSADR
jgi:SSS family solute:Na+ symporter